MSVRYLAKEKFACQHIGRVDSQAMDRCQFPDHGVMPGGHLLGNLLCARIFDLLDLRPDKDQPIHGMWNFGKGVRRDRIAFWREKPIKAFRSLLQMRLEIPDPKTGKHRLQPVDQLCLSTNQSLTFAAHAAGIFLSGCGNCDHPAMVLLTTQPPWKGPHHQLTIQAISLCPAMVPFHRDTRGMHHMEVKDAMEIAESIEDSETLFKATRQIIDHEYVFVRSPKSQKITGIVTATDLSEQFQSLSSHF